MNIQVNRAFLKELAKLPVKERLKLKNCFLKKLRAIRALHKFQISKN